jgi:hypothetical protein
MNKSLATRWNPTALLETQTCFALLWLPCNFAYDGKISQDVRTDPHIVLSLIGFEVIVHNHESVIGVCTQTEYQPFGWTRL